MMRSMLHQLRLFVTTPAARRGIAIFCAISLVLVSWAHTVHHLNGPTPNAVIQADLSSVDDGSNTPKSAALTVEYCLGCSMVAVSSFSPWFTPELAAADLPVPRFNEYRPHPPLAETPPP